MVFEYNNEDNKIENFMNLICEKNGCELSYKALESIRKLFTDYIEELEVSLSKKIVRKIAKISRIDIHDIAKMIYDIETSERKQRAFSSSDEDDSISNQVVDYLLNNGNLRTEIGSLDLAIFCELKDLEVCEYYMSISAYKKKINESVKWISENITLNRKDVKALKEIILGHYHF